MQFEGERIANTENTGNTGRTATAESTGNAESMETAESTGNAGRRTNTERTGKAGRRAAAESKANAESAGSAGRTATGECAANTEIVEPAEISENASGGLPCEGSRFFVNRACEYFPCHVTADPGRFNCLFCYCPLYALGSKCGGNFRWTAKGYKDCTACLFPHQPENYDRVVNRYGEIAQLVRQQEGKEGKHLC